VASLTSQERLQPSLLDRLTDDEPSSEREAVEARVLSKQQLRAAVLRDLSWLFNTTRLEPDPTRGDPDEITMWKEATQARRSVLNYGLPSLAGVTLSRLQFPAIELAARNAIIEYEPRIDPKTLKVEIARDGLSIQHNSLRLIIRGHMWNQPVPLELLLSADVDVETGMAAVRDMRK